MRVSFSVGPTLKKWHQIETKCPPVVYLARDAKSRLCKVPLKNDEAVFDGMMGGFKFV